MQRSYIPVLAVVGAALSLIVAAPQKEASAAAQLQAAINKETVEADLSAAIKQYGAIVAKYVKTDRAVTAMAMVHMAECYQKMGDAESRKIYEQVLREYADQKEAVALARVLLGPSAQPQRQTNTLVWSSSKVDDEGTVSPDGRYLSSVDWDTGNLILHEFATGIDRNLTNKKTWNESDDFAEESAISRDGKQVAYTWFNGKHKRAELRVANLTGDFNPRTLYDNPDVKWISVYDWSPDGKMLAVEIQREDRSAQIGLISVSEGSLRVLKSVDWRGVRRMFFSPDGKYLGYDLPESDTNADRDVFVMATDGTRDIHAVAHDSNDVMMGWSADGKWLLFASDRTSSMGLWGLRFDGGKPQGAPQLLKSNIPGTTEAVGVTASGVLYYGSGTGLDRAKIQLASFDFASGRFSAAPTDLTEAYPGSNRYPQWSPDGNRLAYVSQRGPFRNSNAALEIRSMDTGQVRELRPKLIYFGIVRWAPDGRSLLTAGTDLKGRGGVFRIDAESGDVSALIVDTPAEQSVDIGAWSPDGKSIYVSRRYVDSKELGFVQRNLATGKETTVIRRRSLGGLNVSPDARYIVTPSVDESANARILLLIPVAGGEPRELMRVPSEVAAGDLFNANKGAWLRIACWAPDSRSFLAWKFRGPMADQNRDEKPAWQIPIDGGAPRKLDMLPMSIGAMSVHRDGQRIAFMSVETAPRIGEIWALEHFLPTEATQK